MLHNNNASFVLLDELKQSTLEDIYDKVVDLHDSQKISDDDYVKLNESLININKVF